MWNLPTRLIKVRSLIMFLSKASHWVFFSFGLLDICFFWLPVERRLEKKFCDKFLDVHLQSFEKNVKIHHTGFIVNSRCAIPGCYGSCCPRVVGLLW